MTDVCTAGCGVPLDPFIATEGHTTHPSCDLTAVELVTIRRAAEDRRDVALSRVGAGNAASLKTAVRILEAFAGGHDVFSANDVRPLLDDAGIPGPARGPAFAAAIRHRWIRRTGDEPSTDPATNGHRVSRYQSLIRKAS